MKRLRLKLNYITDSSRPHVYFAVVDSLVTNQTVIHLAQADVGHPAGGEGGRGGGVGQDGQLVREDGDEPAEQGAGAGDRQPQVQGLARAEEHRSPAARRDVLRRTRGRTEVRFICSKS